MNNFEKEGKQNNIIELRRKIAQYYNKQCEGARVRARVQYYEEGETNVKYFLGMEKHNAVKKSITSLKIGRKSEHTMTKIMNYVHKFYSKLYSSINKNKSEMRDYVQHIKGPKLTKEEADVCEGKIKKNKKLLRH